MADLSITASAVLPGSGSRWETAIAGATITPGQVLYRDPADSKMKLADSNGASAAIRGPDGIALNGASAGQPVSFLTSGPLTLNAVLTAGVAYYLSDTPGGMGPVADLAAGEYPTVLGIASSTTVLNVNIQESGVSL